ncbi:MAG: hypothetical protein V3V22_07475 [Methylococcales bacterium]
MPKHLNEVFVVSVIMLVSAVVLAVISGLHYRPDETGATQPYVVLGYQLNPIIGETVPAANSLKLDRLQNGKAVISSGSVQFSAKAFPYLVIEKTGFSPGIAVDLFWRQREQKNTVQTKRLYSYGDSSLTVHLAANPLWSGEIIEFGLSIEGDLKQPLVIKSLQLESWSIVTWIASIWDQWWSYGGWKGTSVNFISGGEYDKIQKIPPPELPMLPIVASWLGVSLVLYFLIWRILSLKHNWNFPFAMFFLAWLLLDSRWLHELWRRTQFTQHQHGAKTQQQKWQSEKDGQWYIMVSQLKQHIPEQSARIFQVMKSLEPMDDYHRFRVRYHLLPHNVFPYLQTLPEKNDVRTGDYILDLNENSSLIYNSDTNRLEDIRSASRSLQPVKLHFQSRLGRLYQFQG